MVALYVASSQRAAGKTTICAGISKYLLSNGKKVGFLKPVIAEQRPVKGNNGDATFMKQVLALPETIDSLCPVIGDGAVLANKVKEAYANQSKDVVIIEGTLGQSPDDKLSKVSYEIAQVLSARVIIVEAYPVPSFINIYKGFGGNLLGIVLNKVPRSQLKRVRDKVSAQFAEVGINVLGVVPEDRVLFALTIGELANCIQGKILNCVEKSAELVESFMLGAMCVDSGLEYFGRKSNKAAVIRGDRPDMQLAALETSTKCLILTGNVAPIYNVLNKAENRGIPIILAEKDTNVIVMGIEEALSKAKFNQEKKLPKLAEVMPPHFDFHAVYERLGLTG